MGRYHIIKDGNIQASTAIREEAIDLIHLYQSRETHFMLRANFSIIYGTEEIIPYNE